MKQRYNIIILLAILFCCLISCRDDIIVTPTENTEGVPLVLYAGFGDQSRVNELPSVDSINRGEENDLKHLGLYVYYTSDYEAGRLNYPYIRNMECRIEDGKIVPVLKAGQTEQDKNIYIYDKMTIVAFYPYNEEMSLEENYFTVKADEENYPITRSDYDQLYIPYRGETTANPTTAYYIEIYLHPKHTFKLEIILVSENEADFNDGNPDIKLLPAVDPVDNEDSSDGSRREWYDRFIIQPNTGGGMHVRKYIAYLWQDAVMNHTIEQNDVLYENGDFTLIATERVVPREQLVYRYGYNFTTGESFIVTSERLINDEATLQAANLSTSSAYQVCDIILSKPFTPLTMINSRYDGGGHSITGLVVNSSSNSAGLFSQIQGNSVLKNVNLINPEITLNTTVDTCFAGALCGRLNNRLSDEDILNFYNSINLPENLSEVVKQALIQEMLADVFNSQAQIIGCRVENPVITVNGTHPRVGTVVGSNGDKDDTYTFKGQIWDTYSVGGQITVNQNNLPGNAGAFVGGFCGLNEYFIGRSYSTITEVNIISQIEQQGVDENGDPVTEIVDNYQGFANQGTAFSSADGAGIDNSFANAPDTNAGVSQFSASWPSDWVKYSGIWPINVISWTTYSANSYWYQLGARGGDYPILHWQRR